jgi:hypothetical protein
MSKEEAKIRLEPLLKQGRELVMPSSYKKVLEL